jgi:phage repressor protein C with HTH and peptisase S24 domain
MAKLRIVEVRGPSMTPTLRDGDRLLVVGPRVARPVRPGDVVVAVFHTLPGRYVVKRAVRPVEDGWWLRSDNSFAGGDSDSHGTATLYGRAVLRWPVRSMWPRRIPGDPN